MKILHESIENNNRVIHYTQDGKSISHTVIEPIQSYEEVKSPTLNNSLEQRVEEVENTLNFILLGGM